MRFTEKQKMLCLIAICIVLFVGIKCLQWSNNSTDSGKIDMQKISAIESSNNPNAISPAGARGQYQIMEATWYECAKMMKVDWNYDTDWSDAVKNKAVGEFYMYKRIPQMLKAYHVPNTQETRLACYNGGIGRVVKAYRKDPVQWQNYLPRETREYIAKYAAIQ